MSVELLEVRPLVVRHLVLIDLNVRPLDIRPLVVESLNVRPSVSKTPGCKTPG